MVKKSLTTKIPDNVINELKERLDIIHIKMVEDTELSTVLDKLPDISRIQSREIESNTLGTRATSTGIDLPDDIIMTEEKTVYDILNSSIRSLHMYDAKERLTIFDSYGRRMFDTKFDSDVNTYDKYINGTVGTNISVPVNWYSDGFSTPIFVYSSSADCMESKIFKRITDNDGNIILYAGYSLSAYKQ